MIDNKLYSQVIRIYNPLTTNAGKKQIAAYVYFQSR